MSIFQVVRFNYEKMKMTEIIQIIQIIQGLGTLIISIIALLFSIYTFRKVSLKGEFKKKQLETCMELVEILQDTIFILSKHNKKESRTSSGTMFRFFRLDYEYSRYKEFIDAEIMLISKDPDIDYKFIKYSEHPYIPTEIAKVLREFIAYTDLNFEVNREDYKSYVILGGNGVFDDELILYKTKDNSVYESFESFAKQCIKLDNVIHLWLRKVGIKEFNKKEVIE
jgi:hypothetical protein